MADLNEDKLSNKESESLLDNALSKKKNVRFTLADSEDRVDKSTGDETSDAHFFALSILLIRVKVIYLLGIILIPQPCLVRKTKSKPILLIFVKMMCYKTHIIIFTCLGGCVVKLTKYAIYNKGGGV